MLLHSFCSSDILCSETVTVSSLLRQCDYIVRKSIPNTQSTYQANKYSPPKSPGSVRNYLIKCKSQSTDCHKRLLRIIWPCGKLANKRVTFIFHFGCQFFTIHDNGTWHIFLLFMHQRIRPSRYQEFTDRHYGNSIFIY